MEYANYKVVSIASYANGYEDKYEVMNNLTLVEAEAWCEYLNDRGPLGILSYSVE